MHFTSVLDSYECECFQRSWVPSSGESVSWRTHDSALVKKLEKDAKCCTWDILFLTVQSHCKSPKLPYNMEKITFFFPFTSLIFINKRRKMKRCTFWSFRSLTCISPSSYVLLLLTKIHMPFDFCLFHV